MVVLEDRSRVRWPVSAPQLASLLLPLSMSLVGVGLGWGAEAATLHAELDAMRDWLESSGGHVSPRVKVDQLSSGERGLFALETLHPGDEVIVVPWNRTLSGLACLENASSLLRRLPRRLLLKLRSGAPEALLHICFVEHYLILKKGSDFWPFFTSVPRSLGHLPLISTLNLTSLLAGSPLLETILKHRNQLADAYGDIVWELPEFANLVSLDDFLFSYCVVESHSHMRYIGGRKVAVMLPFVDLINHRSILANVQMTLGADSYTVKVSQPVKVGEELLYSYSHDGAYSSEFFKQFGFIDEYLPVGVKLAFSLQPHHPDYEQKRLLYDHRLVKARNMWAEVGGVEKEDVLARDPSALDFPRFTKWVCAPRVDHFEPSSPQEVETDLLPYARFVVFSRGMDALERTCNTSRKPPVCDLPLGAEDEAAAIAFLRQSVEAFLAGYPSFSADGLGIEDVVSVDGPSSAYVRCQRDEHACCRRLHATIVQLGKRHSPAVEL
eukprot:TRINITY_DN49984_c0_g1_i1.p1 TRINITY_DN49984_c0_g1~~TRINITY_DN49984_c0_g1_i1.p1  ORF type:complete len:507 (+),score=68.94 TRINITY_DN49984_c0_g1_i1:36-1523(+)